MGVGVSGWPLASAVARLGQLGVVSGTALAIILSRRLQLGDAGGHVRRALARFPVPGVAERLIARHYIPGGKPPRQPFRSLPVPSVAMSAELTALTVAANFVEVFLAREGHDGVVGINYLEKVQIPNPPSLFGAMLAGVDYVLMGAGVPRAIPAVLDRLARGEAASLRIDVTGASPGQEVASTFDPVAFCGGAAPPPLRRPLFLAVVASATLAMALARKSAGRVDGFVVEGASAGGHNAPPRGPLRLSARGEPVYGPADEPDLDKIRALGLPFWLAGSYAEPDRLAEALRLGAAGVQIGTAFAFCEESGMARGLKARVLAQASAGRAEVFTDPTASPTGFPFKVVRQQGTLSEDATYAARERRCDLGYLRTAYRAADGSLGHRCPAEPVDAFVRKGGDVRETVGRKCLCNALLATVDLGQAFARGGVESPIITAGDDLAHLGRFLKPPRQTYTAGDVIDYVLGGLPARSRSHRPAQ
jgi:nitronate monooxygenase